MNVRDILVNMALCDCKSSPNFEKVRESSHEKGRARACFWYTLEPA